MKYFVVSDVHSYYSRMMESLNENGFDINNPEHIFVCCGDLFDRGDETVECLNFVNSLPDNRKILIRGNHEDLFQDVIKHNAFNYHDYSNGTTKTFVDIAYIKHSENYGKELNQEEIIDIVSKDEDIKKYFDSLVDYAEVDNYIFVHGWIPCDYITFEYIDYKTATKAQWEKARWKNGMRCWKDGIIIFDKTIVCGHWHTSWGWHNLIDKKKYEEFPKQTNKEYMYECFKPFIQDNIVALDGCVHYTGKVNCFTFESCI